jgi:hypothetical protein
MAETEQDRLRDALNELRGDRPMHEFAEAVGVGEALLYRLLVKRDRRFTADTLLTLNRTVPEVFAALRDGDLAPAARRIGAAIEPDAYTLDVIRRVLGEGTAVVFLPADSPVGDDGMAGG